MAYFYYAFLIPRYFFIIFLHLLFGMYTNLKVVNNCNIFRNPKFQEWYNSIINVESTHSCLGFKMYLSTLFNNALQEGTKYFALNNNRCIEYVPPSIQAKRDHQSYSSYTLHTTVLYLKLQTNSEDRLNLNLIHRNLLLKHTFSKKLCL